MEVSGLFPLPEEEMAFALSASFDDPLEGHFLLKEKEKGILSQTDTGSAPLGWLPLGP